MIFDLYIVSRDGVVAQSTDFSEYFSRTDIAAYSWSPNGRYIAFAMTGWRGDAFLPTWALLDTETHEVTNYCLQPYFYPGTARPPIWSPNGDQFVVEVDDPEDDDKN
jgi:Tol biopolymer transport system component